LKPLSTPSEWQCLLQLRQIQPLRTVFLGAAADDATPNGLSDLSGCNSPPPNASPLQEALPRLSANLHVNCWSTAGQLLVNCLSAAAAVGVQVKDCEVKLQRADKLIGGLGGERIRWQATVEQLKHDLVNVVGDVVVAAGTPVSSIGLVQRKHSAVSQALHVRAPNPY
jgi:hypothetical protein